MATPEEMSPTEEKRVARKVSALSIKSTHSRDKPILESQLTQKRGGDQNDVSTPEEMSPSDAQRASDKASSPSDQSAHSLDKRRAEAELPTQ